MLKQILGMSIRMIAVFLLSTLSYFMLDFMIWGSYVERGAGLEGVVTFLLVILTRAVLSEGLISIVMGVQSFDGFEFRSKNLGVAALIFGPPLFALLFLLRVPPRFYIFFDQSKLPAYPHSLLWLSIYGALLFELPRLMLFCAIGKRLLARQDTTSLKRRETWDEGRESEMYVGRSSPREIIDSIFRFLVVLFLSIVTLHFLDVYVWAFFKRGFNLGGAGIFVIVVLVRAFLADIFISGILGSQNPKKFEIGAQSLTLAGITFGVPLIRVFNILERYAYLYVERSFMILAPYPLSQIFNWLGSALLYEFPRLMLFIGIKRKLST